MKRFILLLLLMLGILSMKATSMDSIRISLLTCAPGSEIYALFGHSGIRYENLSKQEDWVFNYGLFSFRESNFVLRFVKGETDYEVRQKLARSLIARGFEPSYVFENIDLEYIEE